MSDFSFQIIFGRPSGSQDVSAIVAYDNELGAAAYCAELASVLGLYDAVSYISVVIPKDLAFKAPKVEAEYKRAADGKITKTKDGKTEPVETKPVLADGVRK